jgi:protein-S-isoprenylcysteine O-methyltransferase Ste14
MDLYGQESKSIPQKITLHFIEILLLWFSYWILFLSGGSWLENHLHIQNATGNTGKRAIIFTFNMIIFLRIGYMMFFLLKRKIAWEESFGVPLAFAIYQVGFSLVVLSSSRPLDVLDNFVMALFIFGCTLNTGGEILRATWKENPANKGKIYTNGFFKYSRHINYFGEILWVTSYALMARNWYAAAIPVLLFCGFAFYNAPKLDKYLKSKYGRDYDEYARKTKMLIPYIY